MQRSDSPISWRGCFCAAVLFASAFISPPAQAQATAAEQRSEKDSEKSDPSAEDAAAGAAGDAQDGKRGRPEVEPRSPATPTEVKPAPSAEPPRMPLLTWSGGLEWDSGYARYNAQDPATIDDRFYDHRGRFVIGPLLHANVGQKLFFEATGQLVAWLKEQGGSKYQINVDDAWGKFGQKTVWDVQVGRFEAWPVYNKFPIRDRDARPGVELNEAAGAFDLYTLEDTGALCSPPLATGGYCTDIYEVNFILLREEVGSVAVHIFPHRMLKLELHGKYGDQNGQTNHLGGRFAAIFQPADFIRLSAGAELRKQSQSSPAKLDPEGDGTFVERENGARLDRRGAGGGVVLKFGPVELAGNGAIGIVDSWDQEGKPIADNSPQIVSYGGYGQVTLGPVTLGGAGNYTLRTDPSHNRQTHIQTAGYVYYPFWDNLSLKLVGSYARGTDDPFNLRDTRVPPTNEFIGARLRLKYVFTTL
jgi:hypothetical protein